MATAPPKQRQTASNAVCRYQARSVSATFSAPTLAQSLVVLTAVAAGGPAATLTAPDGFVLIRNRSVGYLQVAVWYYEGAPPMSGVGVTVSADRSLQVRVIEYTGAAQTNSLDKVSVLTNQHNRCDTGDSGIIAQADEVIFAAVANRHASCTQSGFSGGLARLFESVTPQYYGRSGQNNDEDRCRLTVHEIVCNFYTSWRLRCWLSSFRDWIAIICTFRGGTYGPKKMNSTVADPVLRTSGGGTLTAFGKFKSTQAPAALTTEGGSAVILPFNYQYRLNGLLVGDGTPYDVRSHDGLYGFTVRTSDDDQPRGDGSLRGVDLQSAREMVFEMEVGGSQFETEQLLGVLYRTLTPQRDVDWQLVWRHPSQAARMMKVRPINLPRNVAYDSTMLAEQKVALRAADPRHYSAVAKSITVPVSTAGDMNPVSVTNDGDLPAYPLITVVTRSSSVAVQRVQLVNTTGLVTFDVQLTIPPRSTLIGDMAARATGAQRSVITLDGTSKYGSWQLPRTPFRIDPEPYAIGGENVLYLLTDPPGADVICTLDYRDTWAG